MVQKPTRTPIRYAGVTNDYLPALYGGAGFTLLHASLPSHVYFMKLREQIFFFFLHADGIIQRDANDGAWLAAAGWRLSYGRDDVEV